MKILLDFDDFSPKNTNFGLLEKLHEHFPTFKVTLFTVPWEVRFADQTPITMEKFLPWCKALAECDWIEIALHGLTHAPEEFLKLNYEDAKKRIMVGEKMLINRKIPYTRLFKAPFWQLSADGKRAAEDLGFIVAEDGYYNWNLKDQLPTLPKDQVVIAHGHIQDTSGNGLEEVMWKILRLPADTEFGFLSEHFKSVKLDPKDMSFKDPMEDITINYKGKELQ